MGEQGAESLHAHVNKLERTYSTIPNKVDRLRYISDMYHLETSPALQTLKPKVKSRKRRREEQIQLSFILSFTIIIRILLSFYLYKLNVLSSPRQAGHGKNSSHQTTWTLSSRASDSQIEGLRFTRSTSVSAICYLLVDGLRQLQLELQIVQTPDSFCAGQLTSFLINWCGFSDQMAKVSEAMNIFMRSDLVAMACCYAFCGATVSAFCGLQEMMRR